MRGFRPNSVYSIFWVLWSDKYFQTSRTYSLHQCLYFKIMIQQDIQEVQGLQAFPFWVVNVNNKHKKLLAQKKA